MLLDALRLAARGGVRVQVMIPSCSDSPFTDLISDSYIGDLLDAGVELYRYDNGFLHAKLLIVDELGYVPLSPTGAELLFEVFSQRYERGSTIVTSNLPFDEWTSVFGAERLTGALLDRLTHHVHILEMNGDSYRLAQSRARKAG